MGKKRGKRGAASEMSPTMEDKERGAAYEMSPSVEDKERGAAYEMSPSVEDNERGAAYEMSPSVEDKERGAAYEMSPSAKDKERGAASEMSPSVEDKERGAAYEMSPSAEDKERGAASEMSPSAEDKERGAAYEMSPSAEDKERGAASEMSPSAEDKERGAASEMSPSAEDKTKRPESVLKERAGSPVPSCVSMKSDWSMEPPPAFREGPLPTDQRYQVEGYNSDPHEGDLSSFLKFPEEKSPTFLNDDPADRLEQTHLLSRCQRRMKYILKRKCECVFEGQAKEGQQTLLNEIYTELYITEGGTGGVNDEHEVRQIETASKKRITEETKVKCNDIFKPLCGRETPIRTVLTKGVAGIGKTVSVQKFILDWAEGKANQDVHLIFALPFRNLNLIEDEYSLIELLHRFVPDLKSFEPSELFRYKVLFIFDGLDECRLPLDFQNNVSCSDVTKKLSLDVLFTNLIKGNLLPSALLWITSRPAAANQIPPECVHRVTEIRGFSDAQKEEYFTKRFSDQSLASRIITHMKSSKSLFIMCHVPVFCWISATVLERLFSETETGEIPRTLTEMYTHFLIFQTTLKNEKYMKNDDIKRNEYSKKFLLKLGKLASDNLEKGNLIFYEQDLTENGIDVSEASVYSGVCTEVFKEEYGLYQEKVYCFVHLTIQEYLAALYVLLSNSSPDLLKTAVDQALKSKNGHLDLYLRFLLGLSTDSSKTLLQRLLEQTSISSHNIKETDQCICPSNFCIPVSYSGPWRFKDYLQIHKLLAIIDPKLGADPSPSEYIKWKIKGNLSPQRTINLLHCLNELGDNSLVEEVQRYLNSGRLSAEDLSPAHWSALAFVLLMSEKELDVFDLRICIGSDDEESQDYWRLLPVVEKYKTALLNSCGLTWERCEVLASALRSNSSLLRELDLSDNDLNNNDLSDNDLSDDDLSDDDLSDDKHLSMIEQKDSKVKLLSAGLGDSNCKLEILRLSGCRITEEGCSSLASALRSNPSHLRELDLSYNQPGDSGVKLLSAVLEDPSCKLEKLWLNRCELTEKCCEALASAFRSNSSPLRELDLSDNDLQDSGVKLLSAGLADSHCKLEILRLSGCRVREEGCSSLASALRSNPSHLRELDLSYNHPGDSGVKLLSAVLENPSCKLEKLNVDHSGECRIRPGFQKYSCHLTLDPNTAHRHLSLSEGDRKVTRVEEEQPYPDHPERFDHWEQVLCRESLTGRCYWEVEWSGTGPDFQWYFEECDQAYPLIGVTYKGIVRKGNSADCGLGANDKSWSLCCDPATYHLRHNNERRHICCWDHGPIRVGVYLDWEAGTLCFYRISSDGLTLMHRFTSSFTEPLCPGLLVGKNTPGSQAPYTDASLSLCTLG